MTAIIIIMVVIGDVIIDAIGELNDCGTQNSDSIEFHNHYLSIKRNAQCRMQNAKLWYALRA